MSEETTSTLALCHLTGGPQDGARHTFGVLPILLWLKNPDSGFYELTDRVTMDGAHVFEYHASGA